MRRGAVGGIVSVRQKVIKFVNTPPNTPPTKHIFWLWSRGLFFEKCELLHSLAAGCDVELPAYLGIGVEVHTSIKIATQPLP